jgi:phage tail sheath protein FI
MTTTFLHGVEVLELDTGIRPIRTVRSAVIGLVGTAPEADATVFPLNQPVLVPGSRAIAGKLGSTGTLPGAMDGIFDQIGATVVVVRVEDGAAELDTMANVVGNSTAYTGVYGLLKAESDLGVTPKLLIAPGYTHQRIEDSENPGQFLVNSVVAELLGIAEDSVGLALSTSATPSRSTSRTATPPPTTSPTACAWLSATCSATLKPASAPS